VLVMGLGPIGQMSARIARHVGAGTVMGVDLVPERLAMAARHGVQTFRLEDDGNGQAALDAFVAEHTNGRGADAVIEAVGMEAHGSPGAKLLQSATAALPDAIARPLIEKAGIDSLAALYACFRHVRRGGTVSIVGVYGGQADPFPMMDLFDKGVQIRMGQAHVKRWIPDLLPLLEPTVDPLGIDDLTTHVLPLSQAPRAYEMFQKKEDGAVKILFRP
jgi:threonine dehydrogenase-like Zn-dependent dehydrogenase